ncbi:MAG: lysozyme [Desulfurellales bacterium]|nr:MAG: lysozyme [Desulfurellales bacterium]
MSRAALAKTLGGTGAAAALIALVAAWEGKSNDPYADLRGIATVCYGETNVPMRRYSDAECREMLAKSLNKYASEVKRLSPRLEGNQLLAATSLTYNIGSAAYARSTARRRFNAGDLRGGCEALTWFNRAGGRVIPGLVNRRRAEYRVCIADLS